MQQFLCDAQKTKPRLTRISEKLKHSITGITEIMAGKFSNMKKNFNISISKAYRTPKSHDHKKNLPAAQYF